jgi:hypothetical protein
MKQLTDKQMNRLIQQTDNILSTLQQAYDSESVCKIMAMGLMRELFMASNLSLTHRCIDFLNENIQCLFHEMNVTMAEQCGEETRTIN